MQTVNWCAHGYLMALCVECKMEMEALPPAGQRRAHGASCCCVTCMERSNRAFTVWYDADDADPDAAMLAQALATRPTPDPESE